MAWMKFATPGSKYGPCKGNCSHRDCADTRNLAAGFCVLCEKKIGYGKRVTGIPLVHSVCAEDAEDRRQAEIRGSK